MYGLGVYMYWVCMRSSVCLKVEKLFVFHKFSKWVISLIHLSLDLMLLTAIAQRPFDYCFSVYCFSRRIIFDKFKLNTKLPYRLYHTIFLFYIKFQGGDITALRKVQPLKKFSIFTVEFSTWTVDFTELN